MRFFSQAKALPRESLNLETLETIESGMRRTLIRSITSVLGTGRIRKGRLATRMESSLQDFAEPCLRMSGTCSGGLNSRASGKGFPNIDGGVSPGSCQPKSRQQQSKRKTIPQSTATTTRFGADKPIHASEMTSSMVRRTVRSTQFCTTMVRQPS